MPHLTPALPPRYRSRVLATLNGLVMRAQGDVAQRRTAVERLGAAGKPTSVARASLGFAEDRLALLQGRQRFLSSDDWLT
jgi:hypothetical protein